MLLYALPKVNTPFCGVQLHHTKNDIFGKLGKPDIIDYDPYCKLEYMFFKHSRYIVIITLKSEIIIHIDYQKI